MPIAVWLLCDCCIAFATVHCFRDGGVAPTIISRAMMWEARPRADCDFGYCATVHCLRGGALLSRRGRRSYDNFTCNDVGGTTPCRLRFSYCAIVALLSRWCVAFATWASLLR